MQTSHAITKAGNWPFWADSERWRNDGHGRLYRERSVIEETTRHRSEGPGLDNIIANGRKSHSCWPNVPERSRAVALLLVIALGPSPPPAPAPPTYKSSSARPELSTLLHTTSTLSLQPQPHAATNTPIHIQVQAHSTPCRSSSRRASSPPPPP
jgi:hypothetical protein